LAVGVAVLDDVESVEVDSTSGSAVVVLLVVVVELVSSPLAVALLESSGKDQDRSVIPTTNGSLHWHSQISAIALTYSAWTMASSW
jgi:hypothetical protein